LEQEHAVWWRAIKISSRINRILGWATDNRALTDHGRGFVAIRPRGMGRLEQQFRYPADGGRGITAWRNP
jgi:hypothetical protein